MDVNKNVDEQLKNAGVKFLPFVGDAYEYGISFDEKGKLVLGTKENPGKKVLVLGESHYCEEGSEEEMNSFTRDVLDCYLKAKRGENWDRWMNTFLKFERAFYNRLTEFDDKTAFWNHVMFYNYLQIPLNGPRIAGTQEEYEKSAEPFFHIMETYMPDYIIVWGHQLWRNLPEKRWEEGKELFIDDESIWNGAYLLPNSKRVKALSVYHPSVGFSWDFWYKVIVSFFSI